MSSGEDFARAYADWCDELDARNASPLWWATSLASRHPLTLSLPRRLFALKNSQADPRPPLSLKSRLCAALPLGPLSAAARAAWRMALARLLRPQAPPPGPADLLFTLAGPRSFPNGTYRDQFFGDLPEFLASAGRAPLLWTFVTGNYAATIRRLPPGAIPIERTLTAAGLMRALAAALGAWTRGIPVDAPPFEGHDVSELVKEEAAANVREGRFFNDLLYGEALSGLIARTEVRTLYYPFENLARERSLLMALRRGAPRARAVGYQHSPLTARQLNCRLGSRGAQRLPLPDVIVASDAAAARRLGEWGWPKERIRVGCALRAAAPGAPAKRVNGPPRLLVLLSQGPEEYKGLLRLLREAFDGQPDAPEVVLRPHPVIPLAPALADAGPLGFRWTVESGPLSEALGSCRAALYASSAAALDAARAGTPAIWADWGDWLPSDPLEGRGEGHAEARDGASLREAFARAHPIPADTSSPVTKAGLEAFLA
ncbi:MAG: hypothetical protein PHS14_05980 [Elusimicrobia bacterium]|nr:hypothetical protein [Elusimicrobiota bacterium]